MANVEYAFRLCERDNPDSPPVVDEIVADIDCDATIVWWGQEVEYAINGISVHTVDLRSNSDPLMTMLGERIYDAALNDNDFLQEVNEAHSIRWKPTPDLYSPHEGRYVQDE